MGGHAPPLTVAAAVAMRPREWDALMAPRIPPTHPPWGSEQRRRAVYSRRQQHVLHLHGVLHPGGALGCTPSRRGHLASSTVGGEALGPPPRPAAIILARIGCGGFLIARKAEARAADKMMLAGAHSELECSSSSSTNSG